jgi:uridylate kinase
VYECDPALNPDAKRFDELTFATAIEDRLGVMDLTALSMCMEHGLPVIVFDFKEPGNIARVVGGAQIGTLIHNHTPSGTA